MINPKKDRLVYSDILIPPLGYELEKAVATTYSLDIAALLSCMIPLAFSADVNDKLFKNKVSTFTALRNLSKKIVIFCDPSQIKEAKSLNENKEFALLLENMIIPVKLPCNKKGDYPAFHPKMWLLQFVNERGNHFYRFIALSRNISYDKCYDISFVLNSSTNNLKTKKTKPIIEFLEYLGDFIDTNKFSKVNPQKEIVNSLRDSLIEEKISFSLAEQNFEDDDFEIFPLFDDLHRKEFKKLLLGDEKKDEQEKYDSMLVMSPFLSSGILDKLQSCVKSENKIKLFTRQDALNSLKEKYNKFYEAYVLNDFLALGEKFSQEDSDEDDSVKLKEIDTSENSSQKDSDEDVTEKDFESLHDIHAKLYLTQKQKKSNLYIGSANATESGFNKNVELMVRIGTAKKYLNVDNFFAELNPENNPMFEQVEIVRKESHELSKEKEVENLIKKICNGNNCAKVSSVENKYKIEMSFKNLPEMIENIRIKISPWSSKDFKEISSTVIFENLSLISLSDFYDLRADYFENNESHAIERTIKIPTSGIPLDLRNSEIVNGLIKDESSFAEYVTLLLSKDCISSQREIKDFKEANSKWQVNNKQSPLYETLLKASVDNPQALKNLQDDLKIITNEKIVSADFRSMYEKVLKVVEDEKYEN